MSYLVLARKYRPRRFEALVGQEHVVQALQNALTQGRLHHAYLFTGTRGVGKTTVSRILAKALNCTGTDGQGGITAQPCGVCDACRDIDSGRFVDYIELDAASNRGVEEISLLLDQAVYKPVVGRFKVYMIDEVHMLSNTAFNAMLKTLEEPPDYLKFVLATTDPQKVPPTVLSRCLQFNLRPMAPVVVQQHLAAVLADEAIPAEPGALRLLSRAARGSMRDALSLADQAIAFGAGALQEDGVRHMLGAVDRGHAVRIVDALCASNGEALVAAADGLRSLGLSPAATLEEIAGLLQQMALAQAVPAALDASDPDTEAALRLAPRLPADETQLCYSIALHGRAELALAPDEHSGLVMVLLRMLAFRPPLGGGVRGDGIGGDEKASGETAGNETAGKSAMVGSGGLPTVPADTTTDGLPASTGKPATPSPRPAPAAAARAPAVAVAVAVAVATARVALPPVVIVPPTVVDVRRTRVADDLPPWLDAGPGSDRDDGDVAVALSRTAAVLVAREPPPGASAATRTAAPGEVAPGEQPSSEPLPSPPWMKDEAVVSLAENVDASGVTTPAGDRWVAVVVALVGAGSITALVRELAMQSQCVAIEEHTTPPTWRLRVEREVLRSAAHRDRLQAALAQHLGTLVLLDIVAGIADDSPALRDAAERQRRQKAAERIIEDDPLVRALLAQFKTARIVPGSVRPR